MVKCTGLENRQGLTPLVSSNLTASAKIQRPYFRAVFFISNKLISNPTPLPTFGLACFVVGFVPHGRR